MRIRSFALVNHWGAADIQFECRFKHFLEQEASTQRPQDLHSSGLMSGYGFVVSMVSGSFVRSIDSVERKITINSKI